MLAKNSQTPRVPRKHALSLRFFASKLAPTKRPSAIVQKLFVACRQIPRFVPTLQKAIIDSRLF
ncbi:hypothetical protein DK871_17145 [Pseudomonas sp. L13]|nr:hypothetical protein [Pseudomonas sp. L13]